MLSYRYYGYWSRLPLRYIDHNRIISEIFRVNHRRNNYHLLDQLLDEVR